MPLSFMTLNKCIENEFILSIKNMKARIITSAFFIISLSTYFYGQDTLMKDISFAERNSVQIEALGNGFYIFSLN